MFFTKSTKGTLMIKKILFCLFFLSQNSVRSTVVNGIRLPEPRIQNLVICNDSQEFYLNIKRDSLLWINAIGAISSSLLNSLSANQLTLSTKSLWYNVQFFAQLWVDLATLSSIETTKKYTPVFNLSEAEFKKMLDEYQQPIKEINDCYLTINSTIAAYSSRPLSEISKQINFAMKAAWEKNPAWLKNSKLKDDLQRLFTMFTLYKLAMANNYICKDVSAEFILFIPQYLTTHPALDNQLYTATNQAETSSQDIFIGLRYSQAKNFDLQTLLTVDQAKKFAAELISTKKINQNYYSTGPKDLGKELHSLLSSISIKRGSLKPNFQDHYAEILPIFNIFITGHGSPDITANIDTTIIKRTKTIAAKSKSGKPETKIINYQSSDFLDIIKLLNNQLFMKSLTFLSCYPGGKKIKKEFEISSKFQNQNLEDINYPIMLLGSTFAPTTGAFMLSALPPFHNTNVSNSIYIAQKLYGPAKIDEQEAFVQFFNFLNTDTTYEKFETVTNKKRTQHYRLQDANKKLSANEIFSHAKPSYLYAANVFANIYDDTTKKMVPSQFANYVLIKFPHTSWFTPARFKKLIIKLSQISSSTTAQVTIPRDTQAILMDANWIQSSITIEDPAQISFIPINYLNQNYVFEAIKTTQKLALNQFIKQFFMIEQIAEPINILIKNLTLGNDTYTNVYIFIHNDFGAKGTRNGYIATTGSSEPLMTSWLNSNAFEINSVIEKVSAQEVAKLESSVTKNATKQFDSSVKTLSTKTGKPYEVETSGTLSQGNIQKLEAYILAKQKTNKSNAKAMFEKSIEQHKEEQRLKSINALELATMLIKNR